ncbi:hypothetical protein DFH08DRAFT_881643, partial [Mycena albidolilacea]
PVVLHASVSCGVDDDLRILRYPVLVPPAVYTPLFILAPWHRYALVRGHRHADQATHPTPHTPRNEPLHTSARPQSDLERLPHAHATAHLWLVVLHASASRAGLALHHLQRHLFLAQYYSTSIATLRTKARLKPKRNTTRTTTRGLSSNTTAPSLQLCFSRRPGPHTAVEVGSCFVPTSSPDDLHRPNSFTTVLNVHRNAIGVRCGRRLNFRPRIILIWRHQYFPAGGAESSYAALRFAHFSLLFLSIHPSDISPLSYRIVHPIYALTLPAPTHCVLHPNY